MEMLEETRGGQLLLCPAGSSQGSRKSGGDELGGCWPRILGRQAVLEALPGQDQRQQGLSPQREWPGAKEAKLSMSHQQKMSLERVATTDPEAAQPRVT